MAAATTPAGALVPAGPRGVLLGRYETVRAALANDDVSSVGPALAELQAAAGALTQEKAAYARDVDKGVRALVAASQGVSASGVDWKAWRLAFGELSRGVVAMVVAEPALQQGRFLFECPMARGYQRWVQTSAQMMNPYMGHRMLECGSAVDVWRVENP
jgi:hypothetical protein